ncbi:hypothetical protein [Embleya sp. NPDC020630]|uniref:hypothetical protein n=1 Tax=Embleya sp. NPDC020630 TaxID=3363979 RepID=UPI0037AF957E
MRLRIGYNFPHYKWSWQPFTRMSRSEWRPWSGLRSAVGWQRCCLGKGAWARVRMAVVYVWGVVWGVGAVTFPLWLIGDVLSLVGSSRRRPGRVLGRMGRAVDDADRAVGRKVAEAEAELTSMAVPGRTAVPWRRDLLRKWYLAERGLWWFSLFVAGTALVPVAASAILVLMVDQHSRMAVEVVLPSYPLLVVGFALIRTDRIAGRRGRSEAYLRWVAVDTVIACGRRHTERTIATTRGLVEQAELLKTALVAHAHFAYGPSTFICGESTSEAFRAGEAVQDKVRAVLRGDAGVDEVAGEVVRLLEALDAGDPLRLLPAGVTPTPGPRPVPGTLPMRSIALYALAVAAGIATIATLAAVGVDPRAVDVAAAALTPALALPPVLALRRPAGAPAGAPSSGP